VRRRRSQSLPLTFYKKTSILPPVDYLGGATNGQNQVRSLTGHARHVDFEDGRVGADARLGHLAADTADLIGRVERQPGDALSGAVPVGRPGLDRVGVGQFRKQPPGEVLQADTRGAQTARRRGRELAAVVGGDRPDYASRLADKEGESSVCQTV